MNENNVNKVEIDTKVVEKGIPVIPIRGMPIYPGMIFHFDLSKPRSLQALDYSLKTDRYVVLVSQKNYDVQNPGPNDLYPVGCIAKVKEKLKLGRNKVKIMVEIQDRVRIDEYIQTEPFFEAIVSPIIPTESDNDKNEAMLRLIDKAFHKYLFLSQRADEITVPQLDLIGDPELAVNLVCSNLDLELPIAQEILAEADTGKRMMTLLKVLTEENDFFNIEKSIDEKVKNELERNQREYLLREQIRIMQDELGEDDDDSVQQYLKKLNIINPPKVVQDKVETELNRLRKMPSGSSESSVIESYLDWIFDLPWNSEDKVNLDVQEARKILNEDHYALESVKERILEYISVLQLSDNLKSPIICLVGAPGVGKTSIARSIARATGRKYVRLSLGGLRDEAEIRGHRRTYLGSIPGRIIYSLKMAKTKNPLILLDEIDKISMDFKGDPSAALLEVLDPEQNTTFTDNYLELPFDLSNVLFITTANTASTIPEPLLDRMEIIEVNGYVESEKLEIAKRHLVPELIRDHGLSDKQFSITNKALKTIIAYYTRESGVRELKRQIAKICRIAAKEIVENKKKKIKITDKNVEKYLGPKKFLFDKAIYKAEVGLVTGLAWTSVGGETLQIEVVTVPGKGRFQITGQLGEVMQESVQAALSYIRSQADRLGIKNSLFDKIDIHLHVPEGAVPKDGPSAGITIATALISALTGKKVPGSIAMTGEITLRGRVLPIGGLREKLAAANRAGIKTIIYPKENQSDLIEVPKDILDSFEMKPVETMREVEEIVFGE